MIYESYLANASAMGDNAVHKLQQLRVGVVGNSNLSQVVMSNLIGLGVGTILHSYHGVKAIKLDSNPGIISSISKNADGSLDTFEDAMHFLSPFSEYIVSDDLSSSNIILNCESKNELHNSIKLLNYCGRIIGGNEPKLGAGAQSNKYTTVENLVAGALLADEARKEAHLFHQYEQKLDDGDNVKLVLPSILDKSAERLTSRPLKNVIVVGAGGLGTYCTYSLAARNVENILLYDHDVIETKNLNRQLFYINSVGKRKADVLARVLSSAKTGITPVCENFNGCDVNGKNYDAIFCCTDTLESRLIVSDFAEQNEIPCSEGACSTSLGSVSTYIPGENESICVQRNLRFLINSAKKRAAIKPIEPESCVRKVNPSVIGPNVIIGALQAISLDYRLDNDGLKVTDNSQIMLNMMMKNKFSIGAKR
jgi:molybdopterin/thiamine biosynthesis adenylyltransferase